MLAEDFVGHVEQVGDRGRQRVGDQRHLGVALGRPDVGPDHRPHRIGSGACLSELLVFVQDLDELPEMGVPPVPACAFALLQDLLDRLLLAVMRTGG
jgi:hypothetical protein